MAEAAGLLSLTAETPNQVLPMPQYRTQMSGVVALVGRLVDIAATLTGLSFEHFRNFAFIACIYRGRIGILRLRHLRVLR
jgi:hypothetical protein